MQVDFLRSVVRAISDDHRRILNELLCQFASKLSLAVTKLQSVQKKESEAKPGFFAFTYKVNKAQYILKKDTLDRIIEDLEKWQRLFDPSWFLLMRISSPIIDAELDKAKKAQSNSNKAISSRARTQLSAVTARPPLEIAGGLRDALSNESKEHRAMLLPRGQLETVGIPYSSVKAGKHVTGDTKWYIIDSIVRRPGSSINTLSKDVRQLALKLSRADPTAFGLLSCKGIMYDTHPSDPKHILAFDMVFRLPYGVEVIQSLRQLLLDSDEHISLSRKIRIAKELTKSVISVHTFNFVHKNIRPESVLCFEDASSSQSKAFLAGFDDFRSADGSTNLEGDMLWERNVYRHPLRQCEHPVEAYKMQHDIYSLGVCLLEIGLWESFVDYTAGCVRPEVRFSETYSRFKVFLQRRPEIADQEASHKAANFRDIPFKLKDYLVELTKTKLPRRMGDEYARVVLWCLTCLDEDHEIFAGFEESEVTGVDAVAVCFLERIMFHLEQIYV